MQLGDYVMWADAQKDKQVSAEKAGKLQVHDSIETLLQGGADSAYALMHPPATANTVPQNWTSQPPGYSVPPTDVWFPNCGCNSNQCSDSVNKDAPEGFGELIRDR
eukprot:2736305-Prymnesium_polylepis.1